LGDSLFCHDSDLGCPVFRQICQGAQRWYALQVHGWLSWGFLIPLGVVIACFRTVRGMGTWWFHLHRALQILGFLVSLAGLAVGVYLDPGQGGLFWQHKIIGVTVNVLALVQVRLGAGKTYVKFCTAFGLLVFVLSPGCVFSKQCIEGGQQEIQQIFHSAIPCGK